MGSRFVASLLLSFIVTLLMLGAAGYAVTRLAVPMPRDPFRTGSFEFDLAPGWQCALDETEYVCTPPGDEPHSAIAVIALKERGPQDTLDVYERTLRNPKSPGATKPDEFSTVRDVKRRWLGHHEWVEGLREGSELPNYHTYYLGTTTSHLGILVTMSVHKDHEAEYLKQLGEMMSEHAHHLPTLTCGGATPARSA